MKETQSEGYMKETQYGLIYKPEKYDGPIAQNATLGVKFSNDIFISEQKCKDWNIPYKPEDLEDGPFGRCLRIKRN